MRPRRCRCQLGVVNGRRRRCPVHPFDEVASLRVNGRQVDVDELRQLQRPVDELDPIAAGNWLPAGLVGADLRRQPYPCELGAACGHTRRQMSEFMAGLGVVQDGMRITNAHTGEVVHDSTAAAA